MRQGLCNQEVSHLFTIKNITGQNPTTRNQSILHTIQMNIHTNKLWYCYMRNALFRLCRHGSWEEEPKVLKDEDVWGLSKHMLMDDELHMQEVLRMHGISDFVVPDMNSWALAPLGNSRIVLSWIWHQVGGTDETLMSLQALYAQNLWVYPFITQYLRNNAIIIPTHSIILPTLDNTMDFRSICHPHTDTILKLCPSYSFNAPLSFPAHCSSQLSYLITARHH